MRTLTYYVATSVDGFIADPDGDGDFLGAYLDPEYLAYLTAEYPETIPTAGHASLGVDLSGARHFDTVLMGRRSYDPALKAGITSPYGHLGQYVVTRSITVAPDPAVELVSGDVVARVRELKAEEGLGIYLCGGADLAAQLVEEIDVFVVKTYPVFAGRGIPLSRAGFARRDLELTGVRSFGGGQVVTTYARKR
ncbi:dihydrofolate reductase family protein [Streptomyces subrutilus]|uniref:Deaminase n=1 Tax=Streptomyces subrutilus TaxID=36818 RepID=A0A5P2UMS8_9ACTN|nr:dihydrofolate reductase family protein [Streptomyces subrutilus]QEU78844.1 dihydrofolate reductase [Streptomyces subrutilus]WSJ31972.1 dihydrofolate reductase family protein [Streptomyces subrutilus]GGZ83548.1 deaminase [Streptomyces subrutilus]